MTKDYHINLCVDVLKTVFKAEDRIEEFKTWFHDDVNYSLLHRDPLYLVAEFMNIPTDSSQFKLIEQECHDPLRLDLVQRCLIHANKMDEEGWYVTANVLRLAATYIEESSK